MKHYLLPFVCCSLISIQSIGMMRAPTDSFSNDMNPQYCPLIVYAGISAGLATLYGFGAYYAYEARNKILERDPNSTASQNSERSLMADTVFLGISSAATGLSILTASFRKKSSALITLPFLIISTVSSTVGALTTGSIAFGIEDNRQYPFATNATAQKGSDEPYMKKAFGISIASGILALPQPFLAFLVVQ